MTNLRRPLIVEPFSPETENATSLNFATNLNTVEIVAKISVDTMQVRLVLPSTVASEPLNITSTVEWFKLDGTTLVPAPFGPDTGEVNFPLQEEFYIKFDLALVSNSLNVATLRVHDGNYDYDQAANVPPNDSITTEEVVLQINQNSSAFLGVSVAPPTVLFTDYKTDTVRVNWEDVNNVDARPLGSGYKIYYTMEQTNRTGSYKLVNDDPISSFSLGDVDKTILSDTITRSVGREEVDQEGTGTTSEFTFAEEPAYVDEYYLRNVVDGLTPSSTFTATLAGSTASFAGTSVLEKVGAKAESNGQINTVVSWVAGVSVTFADPWVVTGSQTVNVVGGRLKELSEIAVRDAAQSDLNTANMALINFQHQPTFATSVSLGSDTVDFSVLSLSTELFQSVGLVVQFTDGSNIQNLSVVSWIEDVSVSFSGTFAFNHNQMDPLPSVFSQDDCEAYIKYLDERLLDPSGFGLTALDIQQMTFDANVVVNKYKGLTQFYTYQGVDEVVSRHIETASIVVTNYPQFLGSYTYNVVDSVFEVDLYYTLRQSIQGTSPNFSPYYFYYVKTYITPAELDDNEGLYLTQQAFEVFPIYNETFFREITTEVETITRKDELTRLLRLDVTSDDLTSPDVLSTDLLIFFQISFLHKDTARRLLVESAVSKETFASILDSDLTETRPETPTEVDIQKTVIEAISSVEPDLDLKPGSVVRTVFINPFSTAVENLSYREYFREISQSFVTLLEFDEVDSNGDSLAVESSENKLRLRDAYGLDNSTASNQLIQDFIDSKFDLLANNFGVLRTTGTTASGEVTFSLSSLPDDNALIAPLGTVVSTISPAVEFSTLIEIRKSDFTTVKNADGFFTANAFIQSLEPGAINLVPANSISIVNGATVGDLRVTNSEATYGGTDVQNNLELVETVRKKILSVDTGTVNGYLQKMAEMGTVERARIVKSGNEFMRRDFDFSLNRKGYNAVDVYVKGLYPTSHTQTSGFYYRDRLSLAADFDHTIIVDPFDEGTQLPTTVTVSGNQILTSDTSLMETVGVYVLVAGQYNRVVGWSSNVSVTFEDAWAVTGTQNASVVESYHVIDLTLNNSTETAKYLDVYTVHSMKSNYIEANKIALGFTTEFVDTTNVVIRDNFRIFIPISGDQNLINNNIPNNSTVILDVTFRKDFTVPWEKKPFISVSSIVDSAGTNLVENLNYSTYNNSVALMERGSLIEDSGLNIFTSPSPEVLEFEFDSDDAENARIVELDDCWFTSAPYLDAVSASDKFYLSQDSSSPFTVVIKGGYFYINIARPLDQVIATVGSSYIVEDDSYTVFYGPDYSLSKVIRASYNTDIFIDEIKYAYYPIVEFESPDTPLSQVEHGSSFTTAHYNLYKTNDKGVMIRLLDTNFDTIGSSSATLKVTYYNNLPIAEASNFNTPSAATEASDYNVTLVLDESYTLSKRGIDVSSIVVRPTNELEVDLEPYVIVQDYLLREVDDRVEISKTPNGNIGPGQSVDIEYYYSNEVSATFNYDLQVNQISSDLELFAHAGSNYLVKKLQPLLVNIKAIIFLYNINNQNSIDSQIRRDIVTYVDRLEVGDDLFESDIIGLIENVSGVRNVRVKLAGLSIEEGEVSYVETIPRDRFSLFESGPVDVYYSPATSIDSQGNTVSLLNNIPLDGGGTPDKERSVYIDGAYYELASSPYEVSQRRGLAYISSSGSVYVSFIDPTKDDVIIEVTYQVASSSVAADITVFPFQFIQINRMEFTYVEA